MHYKNGREAKNGDKVVFFGSKHISESGVVQHYGQPVVGILYDAQAGNDHCNGKLALATPGDPCPNLAECLHLDDVRAAIPDLDKVADSSKK